MYPSIQHRLFKISDIIPISPKIRGVGEREIYNNFVKDYPREYIQMLTHSFNKDVNLKTKDNCKSISIRLIVNEAYRKDGNPHECIKLYNKSLRYAVYDTENYAIILANRSAMLFKTSQFEKCIEDIDLCLQSQYPKVLRPKVYFRKCESYKALGDREKMKKSVDEFFLFLDTEVSKTDSETYKKKLDCLLSGEENDIARSPDDTSELPTMERNSKLPNASVNVALRQNQNNDFYVSCNKIAQGEVLFVEKAYAFAPYTSPMQKMNKLFCQHCLKRIINGVPCKTCVKYMFCSETCRSLAWCEFHQWECFAIQTNIFNDTPIMNLAFRILCKACYNGLQKNSQHDKYLTVNNLPSTLHNKKLLQVNAENAMLLVFYLKSKTDFFDYFKRWHNFSNKSDKDLMTTIGGLLIRHTTQMQSRALYVTDFCNTDLKDVAFATCPSLAYMSHSCDPNTVYYFHDDSVVVKALTDIDTNTKLTYSFINLSRYTHPLTDRKQLLWDYCHLKCDCPSCQNPMLNLDKLDSYICNRCRGPANIINSSLPVDQYKCSQCNNVFEIPFWIKQYLNFASNNLDNWKNIDMFKAALFVTKSFFNPYNKFYQQLYITMMLIYCCNNDIVGVFETFKLCIDYFETRFGVKSIDNVLYRMFFCELVLDCFTTSEITLPNNFITVLNSIKICLEKVLELVELLYPPLSERVKLMEEKRFKLHTRIDRTNGSNNSCNV